MARVMAGYDSGNNDGVVESDGVNDDGCGSIEQWWLW